MWCAFIRVSGVKACSREKHSWRVGCAFIRVSGVKACSGEKQSCECGSKEALQIISNTVFRDLVMCGVMLCILPIHMHSTGLTDLMV